MTRPLSLLAPSFAPAARTLIAVALARSLAIAVALVVAAHAAAGQDASAAPAGRPVTAVPAVEPASETSAEADGAAIERAVLDYAEAYYEVRPEYAERSIHPELVKVGYILRDGVYEERPMDYAGFLAMVESLASKGEPPPPGPKQVVVLFALDRTALVRLTGSWGIDFMQLGKFDGAWKIRHVVWQTPPPERSQDEQSADRKAVERAALDYLDAFYEVRPELLERSVSPQLAKFGFWRPTPDADYQPFPMDFEQLVDLAARWNADGHATDEQRSVQVVGFMDKVACAVVTASWGIDLVHFTKVDDHWRIVQILWQSEPALDG